MLQTPLTAPNITPFIDNTVKNTAIDRRSLASKKSYESLKKGIWVYFLLLIFEGALRKWVLPGLSNPLLIVRDPVALWLVIKGWQKGMIHSSILLSAMIIIGIISVFTTMVFGHGDPIIDIFGARLLLLHFPLIFVIGKVFTREDVVDIGRVLLWMAIPMTILIGLQFYSPQSAWVNRGIGGDLAGGGFTGANGFYRPPATFSFITGTVLFYAFTNSFLIYFWLTPKEKVNRILMLAATVCVVASIPLSISRSLLGGISITIIFVVLAIARKPEHLAKVFFVGILIFGLLAVLSNFSFFQTSSGAFVERFTSASTAEGGIEGTFLNRMLGGLLEGLKTSGDIPFFGYGLGLGTNVGSQLMSGKRGFTISEDEWGRIVGEMGPLLGMSVILIRISLVFTLLRASAKRASKNDLLPWVLLSTAVLIIPQGQWAQPTTQGFTTLIAGLVLAALKGQQLSDKTSVAS